MTIRHDGLTVDWFGYATTRIATPDGPVVYTDPGRYGVLTGEWATHYGTDRASGESPGHPSGPAYDARDADLVVITHDHHYDDDGVRRVANPDARVLVYEAVSAHEIETRSGRSVCEPEELPYDVQRVAYGDELTVAGVDVRVVPAYNLPGGRNCRADGTPNHPDGFGCGFLLTVDGTTCFWTGDTDVLEFHRELDVSLFLPSIARNLTMNRKEAAALAEELDPDLVLPIHYNTFETLGADSGAFAADVATRGVPIVLDQANTWERS